MGLELGEECSYYLDCASRYCHPEAKRCAIPGQGDLCSSDASCLSGLRCDMMVGRCTSEWLELGRGRRWGDNRRFPGAHWGLGASYPEGKKLVGEACNETKGCRYGHDCYEGKCVKRCAHDRDCPSGEACFGLGMGHCGVDDRLTRAPLPDPKPQPAPPPSARRLPNRKNSFSGNFNIIMGIILAGLCIWLMYLLYRKRKAGAQEQATDADSQSEDHSASTKELTAAPAPLQQYPTLMLSPSPYPWHGAAPPHYPDEPSASNESAK